MAGIKISNLPTVTPLTTDLVVLDRPAVGTGAPVTGKATLADVQSVIGGGGGNEYWQSTVSGKIFATGSLVAVTGSLLAQFLSASNGLQITGSFTHGTNTVASTSNSHAEGDSTTASGAYSHAEGSGSTASSPGAHAEGVLTIANAQGSHSEGYGATASGQYSHAEGGVTTASGQYSHAEGNSTNASGIGAHAEGNATTASGQQAHSEGSTTLASGNFSHAEGYSTQATNQAAHAEGQGSIASGGYSHAEGESTAATGYASHAEGYLTTAAGYYTHAEGYLTTTANSYAHSEGVGAAAIGLGAHAEGYYTVATGSYSHAEGSGSIAFAQASHAEGIFTIASGSGQLAVGKYNKRDNDFSLFVIGDGTGDSNSNRSDIVRVNSGTLPGSGSFEVTGTVHSTLGFSGSLTKLTDGTSYLVAGTNVTIVTGTNGAVTISSTGGGGGSSPEFWFSTVANESYTTGSVYINAGVNGNQNLIKFDISGSAYQSANVNTFGPVVGSYIAVEDVAVAESDWAAYSGSITIAAATVLASGSGGSISVIAGRGGYISGSYPTFGSGGGELLLAAGDGGASDDTALPGGAAGQVSIFAGQGGNGYSDAGAGGNLSLYAGVGGTKTATNVSEISNGGWGGALSIYAGEGGDSQFGGNPGIGGNITISPGPGGKTDTNEDGIAGNVFIEGAYIPVVSASQIASTLTLGSGDAGYGNYYGFRAVSINDSAISILGSSTDTFFFASGSIGAKDTSDRGVAVFGGDAAVSGTMSLEGGFRTLPTIVTSLPYTASMVDYIIAVSASAGPGVALPSAAMIGRNYIVKDVSGSAGIDNISVSVDGGGLIDGSSSYTISINRGSATFVYFGNSIGWGII